MGEPGNRIGSGGLPGTTEPPAPRGATAPAGRGTGTAGKVCPVARRPAW
jgi:hypothetical protein